MPEPFKQESLAEWQEFALISKKLTFRFRPHDVTPMARDPVLHISTEAGTDWGHGSMG